MNINTESNKPNEAQALWKLYELRTRIREKRRTEQQKLLGDLLLLKEIFK